MLGLIKLIVCGDGRRGIDGAKMRRGNGIRTDRVRDYFNSALYLKGVPLIVGLDPRCKKGDLLFMLPLI